MRLLFFLFILIVGCNNDKNKVNQSESDLSNASIERSKEEFRIKENNALDSIRKYKMDSVYSSCLSLLYKHYAQDTVIEIPTGSELTIGECDIRLSYFKHRKADRMITFILFCKDSSPLTFNGIVKGKGSFMGSFAINDSYELVNVSDFGEGRMSSKDFIESANHNAQSPSFANYLANKNGLVFSNTFLNVIKGNK